MSDKIFELKNNISCSSKVRPGTCSGGLLGRLVTPGTSGPAGDLP